jgi:hypothetical protein
MEAFWSFITSNEVLAIIIPALVFMVVLYLVVKRLVSFVITLVLLLFALLSGLSIVNYDVVGDYFRGDLTQENTMELKESLAEFRDPIFEAFKELKDDIKEAKTAPEEGDQVSEGGNPMQNVMGATGYLLQRLDSQEQVIQQLLRERSKEVAENEADTSSSLMPL